MQIDVACFVLMCGGIESFLAGEANNIQSCELGNKTFPSLYVEAMPERERSGFYWTLNNSNLHFRRSDLVIVVRRETALNQVEGRFT